MEHSRPVCHNGLLGLRRLIGSSLAGEKSSERKGDEEEDGTSIVKQNRGRLKAEG
jgi:hypothetical protein